MGRGTPRRLAELATVPPGARGWQANAPLLRHHDAQPLAAPAGLGTTSPGNYVADATKTTELVQFNEGWWHKPHRATLAEALSNRDGKLG